MNRSESIAKISAALAKAQGNMGPLLKDKENPFFKSTYADLAGVVNVCRPALSEESVSFVQGSSLNNGTLTVTTLLSHSSGEWIESAVMIGAGPKNDPQSAGSALTYGRRYGLMAAVGLAPDDDDGNGASTPPGDGKPVSQAKQNSQRSSSTQPPEQKPVYPKANQEREQLWEKLNKANLAWPSEKIKNNIRRVILNNKGAAEHAVLCRWALYSLYDGNDKAASQAMVAGSQTEKGRNGFDVSINLRQINPEEYKPQLKRLWSSLKKELEAWCDALEGRDDEGVEENA